MTFPRLYRLWISARISSVGSLFRGTFACCEAAGARPSRKVFARVGSGYGHDRTNIYLDYAFTFLSNQLGFPIHNRLSAFHAVHVNANTANSITNFLSSIGKLVMGNAIQNKQCGPTL